MRCIVKLQKLEKLSFHRGDALLLSGSWLITEILAAAEGAVKEARC